MKRLMTLAGAVALGWLLVAPALAGDESVPATPQTAPATEQETAQDETGSAGTVPQAQVEIVQKREEARDRRDQLLKIRAQAVQAGD